MKVDSNVTSSHNPICYSVNFKVTCPFIRIWGGWKTNHNAMIIRIALNVVSLIVKHAKIGKTAQKIIMTRAYLAETSGLFSTISSTQSRWWNIKPMLTIILEKPMMMYFINWFKTQFRSRRLLRQLRHEITTCMKSVTTEVSCSGPQSRRSLTPPAFLVWLARAMGLPVCVLPSLTSQIVERTCHAAPALWMRRWLSEHVNIFRPPMTQRWA